MPGNETAISGTRIHFVAGLSLQYLATTYFAIKLFFHCRLDLLISATRIYCVDELTTIGSKYTKKVHYSYS